MENSDKSQNLFPWVISVSFYITLVCFILFSIRAMFQAKEGHYSHEIFVYLIVLNCEAVMPYFSKFIISKLDFEVKEEVTDVVCHVILFFMSSFVLGAWILILMLQAMDLGKTVIWMQIYLIVGALSMFASILYVCISPKKFVGLSSIGANKYIPIIRPKTNHSPLSFFRIGVVMMTVFLPVVRFHSEHADNSMSEGSHLKNSENKIKTN